MKLFALIGMAAVFIHLAAAFGLIDVRLCIGAVGTCNPVDAKPAAQKPAKVTV
ncbi:hypothetical protein DC1_00036 [Burkholderia phage DC1]|uniref:Uncharacterized protein n=1 Tax=Burkholderia phage DC1 TaxID=2881398 RepID=I6NML0_9CAUD|nr:hypothetical protein B862_gp47 [Burkholderia phage DC1]AEZ50854.1 hypothetical protein DC1_00036 [Burkholderia phage DC1]